jgi:hypothetical protein
LLLYVIISFGGEGGLIDGWVLHVFAALAHFVLKIVVLAGSTSYIVNLIRVPCIGSILTAVGLHTYFLQLMWSGFEPLALISMPFN